MMDWAIDVMDHRCVYMWENNLILDLQVHTSLWNVGEVDVMKKTNEKPLRDANTARWL